MSRWSGVDPYVGRLIKIGSVIAAVILVLVAIGLLVRDVDRVNN